MFPLAAFAGRQSVISVDRLKGARKRRRMKVVWRGVVEEVTDGVNGRGRLGEVVVD